MLQMFLGAMAALAVAGVAAGTLYMRQHFPGRRPAIGDDDHEEGHNKRRKDLRRKRGYMTPHDCLAVLAALLPPQTVRISAMLYYV